MGGLAHVVVFVCAVIRIFYVLDTIIISMLLLHLVILLLAIAISFILSFHPIANQTIRASTGTAPAFAARGAGVARLCGHSAYGYEVCKQM